MGNDMIKSKLANHYQKNCPISQRFEGGVFCVLYPPLCRHTVRRERPAKEINQKRSEIP